MGTWPEARAARVERLRAEAARKAKKGPNCRVCHEPTWAPYVDATGDDTHPGCYPVE